jgi:hypothetical protein
MAILKPTTKRLDIPHEPGEWIEIRRLSSLGSLDATELGKGRTPRLREMGRFFLAAIVAWSYPEAPSIDVIAGTPNTTGEREGGLDGVTSLWLMGEIQKLAAGNRTEAELLVGSSPSIGT